jgi:pimeloyl-ACP methyl ester carboxylesterase
VTVSSSSVEVTPEWRKEKLSFSGSDGETIVAYLFLPRIAQAPHQCIVLDPHSGVYMGIIQADRAAEVILGPHLRSGRAVFIIVPKGSLQRPWGSGDPFPPLSSVAHRDRVARWARDNRIGLDYLASRGDIDMRRLGLMVMSNDGGALLFPALEPRYRTVVLVACGLTPEVVNNRPETNPANFLPRYSVPTLVLNGRYDEIFPVEQCARPLYDLLPQPKRLELLNSGHAPPLDQRVPVINRWLDETLGPVEFAR